MINNKTIDRMNGLYRRITGSLIEYDLSEYYEILETIRIQEKEYKGKTDIQLKQASGELINRARKNGSADGLLTKAYALVCEAARRVLKQDAFDVQIIGGLALSHGKLTEMKTGEGKTLTALFPSYLNALTGKGVHILTFNDYLAKRDAEWMGPVHQFLGLEVGYVQEGMRKQERQKAYSADITYLTAKEAGFDFLRDNLCYDTKNIVHRKFNFAIIDEADSILIDEARNPLIIAGSSSEQVANTFELAEIARNLRSGVDYKYDEYERNVNLTDSGAKYIERLLRCGNLYETENLDLLTRLNCSLHAEYLLHRDIDYIVRKGKIELVDEFTGRVADRQRWPDGLQAALETKEKLSVQTRGTVLNSITIQHFLQKYPKICGMTATASSANEEFRGFYNLDVVVIPPNKPCVRVDAGDAVFKTNKEKQKNLIDEILRVHYTGRPILVGTASVEDSEFLAERLRRRRIECDVLNADRDEFEAQIIAQTGKLGAVTISTNMAGRGTDIRLGGSNEIERQKVVELGGLYVIGTNKHESRRIDMQLRGRAGRQGDPGSSRFFISLEDDIFAKYRLNELIPEKILIDFENGELDNNYVRREIDRVQRIIEGQNLEIKKTVCKYSAIIEKQRKIIFNRRKDVLRNSAAWEFFMSRSPEKFRLYSSQISEKELNAVCVKILLMNIDRFWSYYLEELTGIREGIHLYHLGGKDPFLQFQKLTVETFNDVLKKINDRSVDYFNSIRITGNKVNDKNLKSPSATWTYIVNDNPYENLIGLQMVNNISLSPMAGLIGLALTFLHYYKKFQRRKQRKS